MAAAAAADAAAVVLKPFGALRSLNIERTGRNWWVSASIGGHIVDKSMLLMYGINTTITIFKHPASIEIQTRLRLVSQHFNITPLLTPVTPHR